MKYFKPDDDSIIVGEQLFDLEKDPWEQRNLFHRPEYAKLIKKLRSRMERFYKLGK